MKIYFNNVDFSSSSGPNSFGFRLSEKLKQMDCEIVENNHKFCDVFLSFIEQTESSYPQSRKILRLDGIWFKPENFEENNRTIKNSYFAFDHIVFQSEFDKKMIEKHFGTRADCSVIHNGIEIVQREPIVEMKHNNEKIFVCSASWHPQKRLKENILLFNKIRQQLLKNGEDARLYVLGSNANFGNLNLKQLENVFYLNHQSHETCLRLYATADYFIHLAWLDHCPNVVIEALSQGCPVICTDSGGTHEIVKENGIIISETIDYNFELVDYDSPYSLDLSNFVLPNKRPIVDHRHLSIEEVAKKYIKVFKNGKI